jgi:hypothetical protein
MENQSDKTSALNAKLEAICATTEMSYQIQDNTSN